MPNGVIVMQSMNSSTGIARNRGCPQGQQGREGLGRGHHGKSGLAHCEESAKTVGIAQLAPHDLRRTCARLCHASGGELEQIQFLLGHVSVQTTERYLGCKQRIRSAVNDRIGIEPVVLEGLPTIHEST